MSTTNKGSLFNMLFAPVTFSFHASALSLVAFKSLSLLLMANMQVIISFYCFIPIHRDVDFLDCVDLALNISLTMLLPLGLTTQPHRGSSRPQCSHWFKFILPIPSMLAAVSIATGMCFVYIWWLKSGRCFGGKRK